MDKARLRLIRNYSKPAARLSSFGRCSPGFSSIICTHTATAWAGDCFFSLRLGIRSSSGGIIIESAHCGIEDDAERKQRTAADEQRAAEIEAGFEGFISRWLDLPLFEHTPDDQKKLYRELMMKQDPGLMALSLRGFGAGVMPPVCEELHQLHLPLYLVSGQLDDKYVSVMTRMSGLCNDCELQIVEGAGHRVHADRPGKLTEILKTFIETHHHHV
jgi:2-succinyl-6-hydroxy-2,4-cyclohexadiene-1-carboxylate synthase